jgi:hypothetical protein
MPTTGMLTELPDWERELLERQGARVALEPAPDGTGPILGQALLDVDGDVWQDRGNGLWQGVGVESYMPEAELKRDHGPVREVLLVDPAAAQVLEALRAWLGSISATETAEEADLVLAMRALDPAAWHWAESVDALGDTPEAEHDHRMATGEPVLVVGTPPPWRVEAAPPPTAGTPPADPVLAGGPGWDRERLTELVAEARRRGPVDDMPDQVEALLADLDMFVGALDVRSTQLYDALVERDAARAELATARRDAELWESAAGDMEARDRHTAADVLDWAAGEWHRTAVGTNEWPTRDQLHEWATEVRAGTRSIGDVR